MIVVLLSVLVMAGGRWEIVAHSGDRHEAFGEMLGQHFWLLIMKMWIQKLRIKHKLWTAEGLWEKLTLL